MFNRLLLALLFTIVPIALHAQPSASQTPAARTLLQLANQARATHNLLPLRWDDTLARAAQAHLQWLLRDSADLQHQYPGEPDLLTRAANAGGHFSTVAENLAGRGESPQAIQQIWMTTPTHRANLLDPNLNAVGIAVTQANGLFYAVQDFAHNVPALDAAAVEQHVQGLLAQQGINPAPSNDDARKTCSMTQGNAGTPRLVVQWDSADLTKLPDAILSQLSTAHYATAAVGACPGRQPGNQSFTTWHIALLLY